MPTVSRCLWRRSTCSGCVLSCKYVQNLTHYSLKIIHHHLSSSQPLAVFRLTPSAAGWSRSPAHWRSETYSSADDRLCRCRWHSNTTNWSSLFWFTRSVFGYYMWGLMVLYFKNFISHKREAVAKREWSVFYLLLQIRCLQEVYYSCMGSSLQLSLLRFGSIFDLCVLHAACPQRWSWLTVYL